jgi:DNA-directed RNA polymerase subunit RPC12/RpoP
MLKRQQTRLSAEVEYVCAWCGTVADKLTPYGRVCDECLERIMADVSWSLRCQAHIETCCEHEMVWLFDDHAEPGTALYLCEVCGELRRIEIPGPKHLEADVTAPIAPESLSGAEIVTRNGKRGFYMRSGRWWELVSAPKLIPQDYSCEKCKRPAVDRAPNGKWLCERCW